MDKDTCLQYLKRYEAVNKLSDKETRKLSLKNKLNQVAALMLFGSRLGTDFNKGEHLFTNWTLLKSKI